MVGSLTERRPSRTWPGYAAAAWALGFAALSFYWAAGGRLGLGTLAQTIREQAIAREPELIRIVWLTGGLKVLAAVVAMALVRPWGKAVPRAVPPGRREDDQAGPAAGTVDRSTHVA